MNWVLFFDGECGLCSRSIRNLARWDKDGVIHFAPLQGKLAASHDLVIHLDDGHASMVLLKPDTGEKFIRGDCMLQLLRILGGPWKLLLIFVILPRPLRDWLYSLVARNRRRFFKSQDSVCEMPDENLRSRLID